MTRAGYQHRIIIQDRSGSMDDDLENSQAGLDEFIASLGKAPGLVTVSLWDFDTEIRCWASFVAPRELLGYQIRPRGGTDLYGAVGMAVTTEGEKLAAMREDERPQDVVVVLGSDGKHNSTHDWTGPQVQALLDQQQETYKWRVIYMGCGAEAFSEGARMGTHGGLTVNTVNPRAGYKMSSDYLSRVPVAAAFAARGQSTDLTPEERAVGEGTAPPEQDEEE